MSASKSKTRSRWQAILDAYGIEVILLKGAYVAESGKRRALIIDGADPCGVEEYACRYFHRLGYHTAILENGPFHVLFATFMWPVLQDAGDRHTRIMGFGDREAYDAGTKGKMITTRLPLDFGKPEYAMRRANQIKEHMGGLAAEWQDRRRLFDRWLAPSGDLRNYLWAHRAEHIQVAGQLIDVMPAESLLKVLSYLVEHYWDRSSGWPDLLVYRKNDFMLVEVKSESDNLAASQQRWIRDNHERLHLPFKLLAVGRVGAWAGEKGS